MKDNKDHSTSVHFRTCHYCEAMCGLAIEVAEGKVLSIRGDREDVYSQGHLCPKALALQDIHEDPNRLRRPVRRTADGWQEVSWEEALAEVADRIFELQRRYGRDAVGIYTGNPTVHNTGTILYLYDFAKAVGTRNRFASHSLDQLPQMFVNGELYGHQAMFPVPDLDRTDYFLILGANPLVSNGSIMATPNIAGKLRAIRERGGKVVVIDPRRTRTARAADEHFFIRPGTDVLFLLALVHTLFAEQLLRPNHLMEFSDGLEELEALVKPFTPEAVAAATGMAAGDIRRLARELSGCERAVCYGRLGVSVQAFGTLCQWLINVINILTGQLDREGGMMFTRPAVDFLSLLREEAKALRWSSRVRGLPETAGDLPAATMADEILTAGPGQVKGLITIAGNPVLSVPNGKRMDEALASLDFMVAIDIYINETTRHADLILPPATGLEVFHFDFVLNIVAIRNVVNFSEPVLPKGPGTRYDWEILYGLQKRIEKLRGGWPSRLKHLLFDRLTPERRIDLALRTGPYGLWGGRLGRRDGLSLSKLRAQPHGIDLGALEPCLPGRLFTHNKRINLVPETITGDLVRARQLMDAAPESESRMGELLLIGRRHLQSNNSWMHHIPRLMKNGADRCVALLHPQDGRRLGVEEGQKIRVSTATGAIILRATFSVDIMPGVISIPHGWGHDREGVDLPVASTFPGVSVNDLTDHRLVDEVTGNAVFNGIPVKVQPETG